jgi:hypothetical protein
MRRRRRLCLAQLGNQGGKCSLVDVWRPILQADDKKKIEWVSSGFESRGGEGATYVWLAIHLAPHAGRKRCSTRQRGDKEPP